MVAARRAVRQRFGDDHPFVHRALAQAFTAVAYLPALLIHIWHVRRLDGARTIPVNQLPGAMWTALRHNVRPGEYFAYALWKPERRINIDNYLYSHEAARLFKLLNRPLQPDPIGDKLAFHDMCKAHALPTPAVLAAFSATGALIAFDKGLPPQADLFVKPRTGTAGVGAERLRWTGGKFLSNRGFSISHVGLGNYLSDRARTERQTLIVQPALSNHCDLGLTREDALATARLVTGQTAAGLIVPIFAFIYFGRPAGITAQTGYVALIEVATGSLDASPVDDYFRTSQSSYRLIRHANTISKVPDWNAAVELAEAAHRACSNFAFVGWDIALTDRGPMLLEGNGNWTADEYQALSGTPLGHTKFATVLESRLSNPRLP